jgi:hypothetical protein
MKKYLLAAIAICFITACNKKDTDQPQTKSQLLTARPWKQVKIEQRYNTSDPWTDVTSSSSACELDNLISFTITGSFAETEGATKCSSTDPDIVTTGSWSLQNNDTVLQLTITGSGTVSANIVTLDENSLKYTVSDPSVPIYLQVTMGH